MSVLVECGYKRPWKTPENDPWDREELPNSIGSGEKVELHNLGFESSGLGIKSKKERYDGPT